MLMRLLSSRHHSSHPIKPALMPSASSRTQTLFKLQRKKKRKENANVSFYHSESSVPSGACVGSSNRQSKHRRSSARFPETSFMHQSLQGRIGTRLTLPARLWYALRCVRGLFSPKELKTRRTKTLSAQEMFRKRNKSVADLGGEMVKRLGNRLWFSM